MPDYPKATTLSELRHNVQAIEKRIHDAAIAAGRSPDSVRLLPVSKTVDQAQLRLMVQLGYHQFGENKVQEAQQKHEQMQDLPEVQFSIIGHLQRNKAKYVARFAHEFQALDCLELAATLNQRLRDLGRTLNVLVQINTSHEPSKYGLAPEQAKRFIEQLAPFSQLRVNGLMTLALFSADQAKVRECFVTLRQIRELLHTQTPDNVQLKELSMGMSGDFETAIAEGATIVRVGQAIFGARAYPDSYYWPESALEPKE